MSTQGFSVQVCCLRERGLIGDQLKNSGISVVSFNERSKPKIAEVARSVFRLKEIIEDNRIDLVHSFLLRANVEARLARILCSRQFALINSERSINLPKSKGRTILDRLTGHWCDLFLANCEAVKNGLINRERVPSNKIRVIYSGVDISSFHPPSSENLVALPVVREEKRLVGYIGRFHSEKGVRYLIEAIYLLSQRTNNFKVVLVGDGDQAAFLKRLVQERSLQNLVCFLEPQLNVAEILRRLDILVLPSTEEGLPMIIMEAFASGVPVVATAVGGTPEINQHGETGFLVSPKNPSQLAQSILTLLEDEPLRRRFSRNARRLVEEQFSGERVYKETLHTYFQVLKQKVFGAPKVRDRRTQHESNLS